MTYTDRMKSAKAFFEYWKDRGDEKSDSQSFWLALLRDVLGVKEPEKYIKSKKSRYFIGNSLSIS